MDVDRSKCLFDEVGVRIIISPTTLATLTTLYLSPFLFSQYGINLLFLVLAVMAVSWIHSHVL